MKSFALRYSFVFCLTCLFFHCIPLSKDGITDVRANREGFISPDTFQVVCKVKINTYPEAKARRQYLLEICKDKLLKNLAEFKISYDYYKKNQDISIFEQSNVQAYTSRRSLETKKSLLKKAQVRWNKKLKRQLYVVYGGILPGKVSREWTNGISQWILYAVYKKNLLNEVKNKALPFAVEYHD